MRSKLYGVVEQSSLLLANTRYRPAAHARNTSAIGASSVDPGGIKGSFQSAYIAGKVVQQLNPNIKADHESDILFGNDVLEKRPADLLLHLENILLTTARVNQDSKRQGQVRGRRKILNYLGLAIFQYVEVLLRQIGNEPTLFVFNVKKQLHHI